MSKDLSSSEATDLARRILRINFEQHFNLLLSRKNEFEGVVKKDWQRANLEKDSIEFYKSESRLALIFSPQVKGIEFPPSYTFDNMMRQKDGTPFDFDVPLSAVLESRYLNNRDAVDEEYENIRTQLNAMIGRPVTLEDLEATRDDIRKLAKSNDVFMRVPGVGAAGRREGIANKNLEVVVGSSVNGQSLITGYALEPKHADMHL